MIDITYGTHFLKSPVGNNDLTVLDASPLISKIAAATYTVRCECHIDGVVRNKPYWFCDRINPTYPCFLH